MKNPRYLKVIMNYALSSARASLPYSELVRIKIPKPSKKQIEELVDLDKQLQDILMKTDKIKKKVSDYTDAHINPKDRNPKHKNDFDDLITKAAQGYGADDQTGIYA